jgi:hypothetical protein
MEQPLRWLEYKARLMPDYWFAPVGNWTDVIAEPSGFDVIYNTIFSTFIISSFILLFLARPVREDSAWIMLALFSITLWAAYAAILVFAHFEVRYLYFPKFIGAVFFLVQLAMLWGNRFARKAGRTENQAGDEA